jgi:hypothetical protein
MKVRLTQAWGQWSKGHVFTEMPGGQARTLITRGIAEEVTADAKQFSAPVNRMMVAAETEAMRPNRRAPRMIAADAIDRSD